jgi:hypothetical protein
VKEIYKYNLGIADSQMLNIPSDTILSVQEQNEEVVVYALVETESPLIKYEFVINGTGNPISFDVDKFTFLGTVNLFNGALMFHVFYRKAEPSMSGGGTKL